MVKVSSNANVLEYQGYIGVIEYDDEAGIFHGEVINLRDVITFQGTCVDELRQAFIDSVEDYLAFCRERNEEQEKFIPGGRRVPRPQSVEACPECGEALGGGYAECPTCHEAIERIWLADWEALLEQEHIQPGSEDERTLARVVVDEAIDQAPIRHPWTIVDIAMSLLRCSQCGQELGQNYPTCAECGMAFGASILAEYEATANEHALHIGRWVLRFPQVHSTNARQAWRLTTPRILTGWLPATDQAQRSMRLIKQGRLDEAKQAMRDVDRAIDARGQAG